MTNQVNAPDGKHEHQWSEWKDDKPMNIKSQKELIILSARQCIVKGCDKVQSRIGRVEANT